MGAGALDRVRKDEGMCHAADRYALALEAAAGDAPRGVDPVIHARDAERRCGAARRALRAEARRAWRGALVSEGFNEPLADWMARRLAGRVELIGRSLALTRVLHAHRDEHGAFLS